MRRLHILYISCLALLAQLMPAGSSAGATGQLIVFVQPGAPVSDRFSATHLSAIGELAAEMELEFRVIDAADGAPDGVAITPLIVFQNHLGRSIYQGRYSELEKLTHFIRTSAYIPQGVAADNRIDVPVWQRGKATVVSNIKVTALAGTLPNRHREERFHRNAIKAVAGALARHKKGTAQLRRTDRSFYMDFYPYRAEDGDLFVSMALFSQFNCAIPIYTNFAEPLKGRWRDYERVFRLAAETLEREVAKQIDRSEFGDDFDPVDVSVKGVTWDALGLQLPEPPKGGGERVSANVELADRWRLVEAGESAGPRLLMRFLPPMDNYSGEAWELDGELTFAGKGSLEGATGWIDVTMASITTGDAHLDETIHDQIIKAHKFPKARFRIDRVDVSKPELVFGELKAFAVHGMFELVGIQIPLTATAQVEPVISNDGSPRLHFRAAAQIRLLGPFGLEGPPLGPMPARDTLIMYLNFLMRPVDD